MVELLFKWLAFLADQCPLLVSSIVLAGIFILLAGSIKKHPARYYLAFALPAILYLVQLTLPVSFREVPLLGEMIRVYVHAAGLGYPLIVIIIYAGALSPRHAGVRKLLLIRKELSIISGFPVLVHALARILHNLPGAFAFFGDTSGYMEAHPRVQSCLGAGLGNAAYLLGIAMTLLFLLLWITSFDAVHKRLGARKWKKVQNWSYALYAMLFVHSVLIHAGWMLSTGGGQARGKDVILSGTIGIASTCLVFGAYLLLRLRKRKADALKKNGNA
jgi:DMSO/TMAO reductase YedYZ heme-binding membrane subunit